MDLSRPRCRLWRKLVLVASLLACGITQASSQMYISPDPFTGFKGFRSLLTVNNAPKDVQEYSWHRGANDTEENPIISYNTTSHSQQNGPMYSGWETVSHTGALLIKDSQLNDTGNYTVWAAAVNDTQRATVWLEVRVFETPGISVNTSYAVLNVDSVAAICQTNDTNVQWYIGYTQVSSYEHMTISPDTRTLIIKRVRSSDSPLQCGIQVFSEITKKSELVCLTVTYGPSYATIFSTPVNYQGILPAEIGSQVKMECFSDGRPQVKYHWIHNISVLSFSEKNITLPSLTWDQMGRYRCIAENPATHEVLYDEVQVQTHMPRLIRGVSISAPFLAFLITGSVMGSVIICGYLLLSVIKCYSTRRSGSRPRLHAGRSPLTSHHLTARSQPDISTSPFRLEEKSGHMRVHLKPGGQDQMGKEVRGECESL